MTRSESIDLNFVTCVSSQDVLRERLLASPCLTSGEYPLVAYFNATSAAQAFNATAHTLQGPKSWLVWVHQDVYLPVGWDQQFKRKLQEAEMTFPALAVAGVYGVRGVGASALRAGHVLDRGRALLEPAPLPSLVDSLDELLFAVRCDSGVQLDAALPWDFYATDAVLQAQASGLQACVVDAYCEHWSDTPTHGAISRSIVERIARSGATFEAKWASRLPVHTPWLLVTQAGDVQRFAQEVGVS